MDFVSPVIVFGLQSLQILKKLYMLLIIKEIVTEKPFLTYVALAINEVIWYLNKQNKHIKLFFIKINQAIIYSRTFLCLNTCLVRHHISLYS